MSFILRNNLLKIICHTEQLAGEEVHNVFKSIRLSKPFNFCLEYKTKDRQEADALQKRLRSNEQSSETQIELLGDTILQCRLTQNAFTKHVLETSIPTVMPYAINERVLIEYSSPNIAKPFHVGHLRSTIIGNHLANINRFLGNDVVTINYLGDYGPQFGYIQKGLLLNPIDAQTFKDNPIYYLYLAYVAGHKAALTDPQVERDAIKMFASLENDEAEFVAIWQNLKNITVPELMRQYSRLNIEFQEYEWESMYNRRAIADVVEHLTQLNMIQQQADGRKVVALHNDKKVPILKSDGSTLYLLRDIAAVFRRFNKFAFDRMLYVVDHAQSEHFQNLFAIIKKAKISYADKLEHVQFGRIRGMSTRKGTGVFLDSLLDLAKENAVHSQEDSKTTKYHSEEVSDQLGVTAVIINDLKQRRTRDYTFDWTNALLSKGDSGIKLQYTLSRLHSLETRTGIQVAGICNPLTLQHPSAVALIEQLALFPEAIVDTFDRREACILVNYLFTLCNTTSKALKTLNVLKEVNPEVQQNYMLLFHRTKEVLVAGMKLLGLRPLYQM